MANPFEKYATQDEFVKGGWKRSRNVVDAPISDDDPTKEMTAYELFGAGLGKRGREITTLGLASKNPYDKYLMNRPAAVAGSITADLAGIVGGGKLLQAAGVLPRLSALTTAGEAMVVPNTVVKAATTGGAYSALTTPGGVTDRAKAGAFGATGGLLLPLSGTVVNAGRALVEPLTAGGQRNIAGRTLQHFAGDDAVIPRLENPEVFVPGSLPTAAEASGNVGLSRLSNSLGHLNPEYAAALKKQQDAQRAARLSALQSVAGDDAKMQAAIQARDDATDALYAQADSALVPLDSQFASLTQRPIVQRGISTARTNAANRGEPFHFTEATQGTSGNTLMNIPATQGTPATVTGKTLHQIKLGIDDALKTDGSTGGARVASASELEGRGAFLKWLEDRIDVYGIAKNEYARLSKPINQMEIGQELLNKLKPALSDFGAGSRENAATFATAIREADKTAAKATGFAKAKMEDILTPDQLAIVQGVAKDLGRKANTEDMVRGVGSNTASNLATQNIIRQIFGPLGLPQSWAESAIPQTLTKPLNMLYSGVSEPKVASVLAEGLLNPQLAAQLMKAKQKGRTLGLLGDVLDYAPTLGIAAGIQANQ